MSAFLEKLTLFSLVKTVAYIHHYTIPYQKGRGMPTQHLRQLSHWIDDPKADIRSIRGHKNLAAHLVLLQASTLLTHDQHCWQSTPFVHQWLNLPTYEKYQWLLDTIAVCHWKQTIDVEQLHNCLDEAYGHFLHQTLSQQQATTDEQIYSCIWGDCTDWVWILHLPTHPPLDTLFHLLQIGEWQTSSTVQITPVTIHQANKRGYSLTVIEHLLNRATENSLTSEQQKQLIIWYKRGHAYTLQTVHLLSTAQPQQMDKIKQNRRLCSKIIQQISPRHAIVQADIQTGLKKWVNKQSYPFNTTLLNNETLAPHSYYWLAVHLLAELAEFCTPQLSIPQYPLDQT